MKVVYSNLGLCSELRVLVQATLNKVCKYFQQITSTNKAQSPVFLYTKKILLLLEA